MSRSAIANGLVRAARALARSTARLRFSAPVRSVYRPLDYAWAPHRDYLLKYGAGRKRVIFLGMNPGPFGMAQTGVPFGEVAAVRNWMGISAEVKKPKDEHPARPVFGFACERSEVSGKRLWGLFAKRFGTPEAFFAEHLVLNYCPLVFLEASGKNFTPDKLPNRDKAALFRVCDDHLLQTVEILNPEWVVGVGDFAAQRATVTLQGHPLRVGRILHPSPASPAANRGWAEVAQKQLEDTGVWERVNG